MALLGDYPEVIFVGVVVVFVRAVEFSLVVKLIYIRISVLDFY